MGVSGPEWQPRQPSSAHGSGPGAGKEEEAITMKVRGEEEAREVGGRGCCPGDEDAEDWGEGLTHDMLRGKLGE